MKKYEKPVLTTQAYAQFENVFTYCSKGNAKRGCVYLGEGNPGSSSGPGHSNHAAFNGAYQGS